MQLNFFFELFYTMKQKIVISNTKSRIVKFFLNNIYVTYSSVINLKLIKN